MEFTGYLALGTLDLSEYDYDTHRELSVHLREADGAVFVLNATGCLCCVNLYNNVTDADLEPVAPETLAEMLVRELNENGGETPEGRLENEEAVRTILRAVAARAPRTPLAIEG